MECDSGYTAHIEGGFMTKKGRTGDEELRIRDWDLTTPYHYYCVSPDGEHCLITPGYQGQIYVYISSDTVFWTWGPMANQNMRWTFFILAACMIAFGVIMILGELHVPLITTKFTFFYYSFVKGLIYFAVGFLLMGMSNLFGLFVAMLMWIVGILNCIYGWRSVATFQWTKVGARGTTTIVTRREYI